MECVKINHAKNQKGPGVQVKDVLIRRHVEVT